jgi:hypothetical protein
MEELKRFESGNRRVRVVYDEYSIHPYIAADMPSTLACWNEDQSFLPGAFCERTQNRLDKNYTFIKSREAMKEWLDDAQKSGEPFLVYGVTFFDKYAGLVLHDMDEIDGINNKVVLDDWLNRYEGAIFMDKARFRTYVDSEMSMSDVTMTGLMANILRGDFAELNAWSNDQYFGVILETQCEHCDSWVETDSGWGFYLVGDEHEMFKIMAEHLPDDFVEIRKMMTGK